MSQMDIDFSAHILARGSDPDTSVIAAMRSGEFRARHIAKIYAALRDHGCMNKDEIAAVTGMDHIAVARRMKEGTGRFWKDSGKTRLTRAGRPATVWEAI